MIYLMDGCIAIFILFNIFFSIRTSFGEYLQMVLSYAIPFVLLSLFLGPVYQFALKQNLVPAFITKLSASNYHLVYYFGLKLALFIILVILFKIILNLTIGRIIYAKKKPTKRRFSFLINIPIAIIFALSFSCWLIYLLSRLGVPYYSSYTHQVMKYSEPYFDVISLHDNQHALEVYKSAKLIEESIRDRSYQVLEADFDVITKPMFDLFTELKAKLSTDTLNTFSGDDWQDLYDIYHTSGKKEALLVLEKDNASLSEIKRLVKDIEVYQYLIKAYITCQASNPQVSAYMVFSYMEQENLTSNSRKVKQLINRAFVKRDELDRLRIFTANYLSLGENIDDATYEAAITNLLNDNQEYQMFLMTLIQEYPSGILQIRASELEELARFEVSSDSTLNIKSQYIYQNVYVELINQLTSKRLSNQYIYALFDDLTQNDEMVKEFIDFVKYANPTMQENELIAYFHSFNITSAAKTKLVNHLNTP